MELGLLCPLVGGTDSRSATAGSGSFLVSMWRILCRRNVVEPMEFITCLKSVCGFGIHVTKDRRGVS